jgi:hypothetical protein
MEEMCASYKSYDLNIFLMVIYGHMFCLKKIHDFLRLFGVLLISCYRKSSKYN